MGEPKMKVNKEIAHGIVMKLGALGSNVRCFPHKITDPILLNGLGKCLEAGVSILRHYIDDQELEEFEAYLEEFDTRYKSLMILLRRG